MHTEPLERGQIKISSPYVSEKTIDEVSEALRSGNLTSGVAVKRFEREFAEVSGCRYGVATTNGTTALVAALYGVGVRRGDVVITTPFSFIATATSILALGGVPHFCDVDLVSGNIQPDLLVQLIEQIRPAAVVVVHLFGNPMRLQEVRQICTEYGVKLVEDCAQAHGAISDIGKVGSIGDAAAFSFYATKNVPIGEGGMVTTNDEEVASRISGFINHGMRKRYHHEDFGLNFRMMEIQGLLGLGALAGLPEGNKARIRHAEYLRTCLNEQFSFVNTEESIYHQLTLRTRNREALGAKLLEEGIGHGVYYPSLIPDQPVFREFDFRSERLPNAKVLASQVLSIPTHPQLTSADLERIIDVLSCWEHGVTDD